MSATLTASVPTIAASAKDRAALRVEGDSIRAALHTAYIALENAKMAFVIAKPADCADDCDDATFAVYCDALEDAADASGKTAAEVLVRDGEAAIIAWAEKTMRAYFPAKFAAVAIAFEKGPRHHTMRVRLIDLCIKLRL